MKKIVTGAELVFLAAFFALLVCGVATMPFLRQDGAAEKRVLAAFPSLTADGGPNLEFPQQFEDWLNDHIGLRALWRQRYARLHARLGASASDKVIVGRDGWLFYGPTVPDYTGVGALTENELWRVKYTLELIARSVERPFVALFAPNKNTVYPEYMPARYPAAPDGHALQWLAENCAVPIVDALGALDAPGLYYRTDTHWNDRGARIAAGRLIESLAALTGVEADAPDPDAPFETARHTGDLGQMLFPQDPPADEGLVYADAGRRYEYVGHYRTQEDMTIATSGGDAPLSLLVLRDSFTNALIEPLSNAYSAVQYRRAMPLPLSDARDFDAVVLEMVERRIGELLTGAPVIPARETEPWPDLTPTREAEARAKEVSGGVRLYGRVDAPVSRLTQLTVSVSSGGETRWYEAFPAGEDEFAGDGAFSLLLDSLPEDAVVRVYMAGGGEALVASADLRAAR